MDSWLSAMSRLFPIRSPWLLSNLFCCLWKHGSFPSMNSFGPCNQLWLVLFNINLPHFFSKKDTNQLLHTPACEKHHLSCWLTILLIKREGGGSWDSLFSFFSFKVHKCQLPQGYLAQLSSVMERTKLAWSKGCRGPTAKMEGGKETTGFPEVWMSAEATATCVFTQETCWADKGE